MKVSLLISLLLVGLAAARNTGHRSKRSLDGSRAYPGQFPFFAFLRYEGRVFDDFGTGSLISPNYVLSSQFGTDRTQTKIEVILGAHNWKIEEPGQVRFNVDVKDVMIFHDGTPSFPGELALIPLPEPVEFSDTIQPVLLPSWEDVENLYTHSFAIVGGWSDREFPQGPEPLETVRYTEIQVVDQDDVGLEHWDHLIVADRRVANWWEVGAPLFVRSSKGIVQIGIYSFFKSVNGPLDIRDFYQRIAHEEYLQWIQDNTDIEIATN